MRYFFNVILILFLATATNSFAEVKSKTKKSSSSPLLKSTIYCTATVAGQGCDTKSNIIDSKGNVLISVCPEEKSKCILEGACFFQMPDDKKILVNYVDTKSTGKKNGSQSYFKIVDTDVCPYGLGVKNSCLDPYYTVAADAKYHKPGDVIYVDKLRGLVLPNGTNHTGFLIVRDIGKKITGPHRFDFFSGDNCNVLDPNSNPFASMNLQSKESKIPYRAIKDSKEKARIQAARNYPGYPLAKPITANKPQNYIQKGLEQLRSVDGKGGGQ